MLGDREMEPLELPPSHAEAMAEVDRLRHQALEPTPWRMHDEAMRMRALEAGARLAEGDSVLFGADGGLTRWLGRSLCYGWPAGRTTRRLVGSGEGGGYARAGFGLARWAADWGIGLRGLP
jgi:hypothetical protein